MSIHKTMCGQCGVIAWEIIGGRPVIAECRNCKLRVLRLPEGWSAIPSTIIKQQQQEISQ